MIGRNNAFHFIICGESRTDAYFLHIEIGVNTRSDEANEKCHKFCDAGSSNCGVSVALVEESCPASSPSSSSPVPLPPSAAWETCWTAAACQGRGEGMARATADTTATEF